MKKIFTLCSIVILFFVALTSYAQQPLLSNSAANVLVSEKIHNIINGVSYKQNFANDLCARALVPEADRKLFLQYLMPFINQDKLALHKEVTNGHMGLSDLDVYAEGLKRKYIHKYEYFLLIKDSLVQANFQAAADLYNSHQQRSAQACGASCTNPSFEDGTTNGWTCYSGIASGTAPSTSGTSSNDPMHNITQACTRISTTTGAGYDAVIGGTTIPVVCPSLGNYSCLLENDQTNGGNASRLSQSFTVSATNANFTYAYAVVLEDPDNGLAPNDPNATHGAWERPRFYVTLKDASGNPITCGNYDVTVDNTSNAWSGFHLLAGTQYWYKTWTTIIVPLQSYIGQCVTIEFTVLDCSQGGHAAWAYIDADCSPLDIVTSSPSVCGGQSLTLSAPPGAASYSWTVPSGAVVTPNTTSQTITTSTPGNYSVVLTSVSGPSCQTTLNITIGSSPAFPVANFKSDTVCVGSCTQFADLSTPNPGVNAWHWDFGTGNAADTSNVQNPSFCYLAQGTYPVKLSIKWGTCAKDTTINITVTSGTLTTVVNVGPYCASSPAVQLTTNPPGTAGTWSCLPNAGAITAGGLFTPSAASTTQPNIVKFVPSGSCSAGDTASITVMPGYTPTITQVPPMCADGTPVTVSFSPPGGTWTSPSACYDTATHKFTPSVACVGNNVIQYGFSGGCSSTASMTIVVNPLPVVDASPGVGLCQGTPHTFTVSGASTYVWTPGGAGSSITVTPNNTQIYSVIGTDGNGCKGTDTTTYTVYQVPAAAYSVNTVCQGIPTAFTDQSVGATQWFWTFNDPCGSNNTSTSQSPTHVYCQCGNFQNVSLIVTSVNGCQNSISHPVTVNCIPQPCFSTTNVCKNTSAAFANCTPNITAPLGGPVGYHWDFAGGSAVQNTASATAVTAPFSACGTYNVTLTATSTAQCTHDTVIPITIYCEPTAAFTKQDVCQGSTINFDGSSSSVGAPDIISTYTWDYGSGGPSSGPNPTVTKNYPVAGHYSVKLTVTTANNCTANTTVITDVYPRPLASFDTTQACDGKPVTLTNTSTVTTPNGQNTSIIGTYLWDFDYNGSTFNLGANTSVASNTYPASGCYNPYLKIITNFGCRDSVKKQACVNPNPIPLFSNTPNGCEDYVATFRDSSTITATNPADSSLSVIDKWTWDFGNGTTATYTTGGSHTHTYTDPGTFNVSLTVTTNKGCSATSNTGHIVTVWPKPTAAFTASPQPTSILNPDITFDDQSRLADTIVWTFGDGSDTIFRFSPETMIHHYKQEGTYCVTQYVVTNLGCTDEVTHCIIIDPEVAIYVPNAFTPNADEKNDYFMFKCIGIKKYTMYIFDRWGNKIFKCEGDSLGLLSEKGWNGKANGGDEIAQIDQYVYEIIVTDIFDKKHPPKVGQFSLIK